ncbi:hypothetical protein JL857_20815 [Vibrio parahaemolyticus]|uniref:Uncharacterized protein n=1 Tax=Vibrio parahaemolyticus TaxID=670 RepID=A0A9Q3UGV7_VIBPH|nr:hypothetical protein [Vibrio parahaemolyticus]MCC3807563.1 hypothetical protein [Vibrio parahaemolyticus]MCI9696452.1 hypothetical protein [Vibrio parahaemolyticus]MCI9711084.1 hypothetical protein [Vibrio parahaemolyticus]MCI9715964.1 hypothetical protein [Vibrio parahaemolyticus]
MQPTSNQSKGFKIASDSQITPAELVKAGFTMKDFRFHPAVSLDELKRAFPDFWVSESSPTCFTFQFDRLPF